MTPWFPTKTQGPTCFQIAAGLCPRRALRLTESVTFRSGTLHLTYEKVGMPT
jgi:hypothetical protein